MAESPLTIEPACGARDIAAAAYLFREYMDGLGIDLSFQDAGAELAGLPGRYAPPAGCILIARRAGEEPLGIVAIRPLPEFGDCEIKRLYVRPQARGLALGRRLAEAAIGWARDSGYGRVRLDTLAFMQAAQALYGSLGFRATAPYYDNPVPGTLYMALDL